MKPGRKPTPTATLKLRGSWRAKIRKEEPQFDKTFPVCPSWLGDDAKNEWRRIIPILDRAGLLTTIDRNALARYCDMWAKWRKMSDFLNKMGEVYTIKDDAGNPKYLQQAPQVGIYNKLCDGLSRLEAEFGMTPSSRTRISVRPKEKEAEDPAAKFFG